MHNGVDYFVIELDRKAVCLLCSDATTMLKEYSITEEALITIL